MILDSNETKKLLAQLYNDVSKELFGVGTTLLKVTVANQMVTIQAKHKRAARSIALEGEIPSLKLEVDFHLSLLYKRKFAERLEAHFPGAIDVVLRDYDAHTQWAVTNLLLHEN
ncbi:hypothetical protein JCM19046_3103 [Bacillus sp. JCM 19046]|uniref:DUF2294 domain-containing protein n=1 Tax=Shouchella xiaoxiensis TaxID=766895 RepID=A0ABS2SNM9_9BACI|nr:DUF2294 domain-containing protein [Shouchella xiaoxiensis]MBM7837126.1 hypothetical protein [Shouchella xiaoxiensis]GAF11298.1 hypothetical protein JCM19045_393 [Bacillus sp. JCM 19045]GAF18523.1 hypothetical protein JCM19046_3103 [Bacillus sp. JCM 19046]